MNYTAVFALAIAVLLIIYYGNIYLSRFKLIGHTNPNSDGDENGVASWQLYYFHAPHCGACKSITPWITEQTETHSNVVSIDISQDVEVARKFNVRATPTVVFIENNTISDVQLGSSISQTMKEFIEQHGSTN